MDRFPCKDAITHEQMYLALPAVDLTRQLADHAREESLFARQQVLVHTKASEVRHLWAKKGCFALGFGIAV
ncbi:MAG: hypothetical protein EBW88_05335 [Betaproteobacteria bacterium]|nr:hypothetical protein [Betaproteobacteria bacterium]